MKKLIATITLLLLLSTTVQSQQYYKLINGDLYSTDSPSHIIQVNGEVTRNESGEITEYRVINKRNKTTVSSYDKLTNDEKGFFEFLNYRYALKKKQESDDIKRDEQKILQEKAIQDEIKNKKNKKIKDSLAVEKQKISEDSLRIKKEKNVNGWDVDLDNEHYENTYKINMKLLPIVERQTKVGGYFQTILDKEYAFSVLPVGDYNISYKNCNVQDLVSLNIFKSTDVFCVMSYGDDGIVLIQNKKTEQMYIGDRNVIFRQPDIFKQETLFTEVEEKIAPKVLSVEEVAIQNRYKNILTTYKTKLARINAICNKKAYEVRYRNGSVAYDTSRFTKLDKKEYNELDLWFENANGILWGKIKEDELSLNGNNDIMEKLLENDTWLNLKVGLEQSQSIEHIYN